MGEPVGLEVDGQEATRADGKEDVRVDGKE